MSARRICLFLLLTVLTTTAGTTVTSASPAKAADSGIENIVIDAKAPTTPFPHKWEEMFGSGRAILSLRESYRADLRLVKTVADVKYVRFHNIFHDEVGVYNESSDGKPIYNWTYVDQIYDGLLENGVRPFVELSFMPDKLAAKPATIHSFWYKPNVTPPKDWQKWADLNSAFARHLIDRYGIAEVSKWYFEVWNEPDIEFWAGNPREKTYYELYDCTAKALKQVSPQLKVGGPACAMNNWLESFIRHCHDGKIPLDFVSCHTYASGDEAVDPQGKIWPDPECLAGSFKSVRQRVRSSPLPNLPIIWSEYNACWANNVAVTDSTFMGPWLAYTVSETAGLADGMSFWTFSDVFEENGIARKPFYGGFGLIATGGIPKPAFNAFKLMHQLGSERLPVSSKSALATRKADGSLAFLLWNYTPARQPGSKKSFQVKLSGLEGARKARITRLDKQHGSSLSAWRALGEPDFPTREQQKQLQEASAMPPPVVQALEGSPPALQLELDEQALVLVEID
jgi:xylan 1,4-beta-xylosidase